MELIVALGITWLIMRSARLVKDEWRHSRDTHALALARHNPGWSPGRVRRNARRRARGDWWTEVRDSFPSLRRTLAEDRELARTVRAEAEAEGAVRIRELRMRTREAVSRRDAARRENDGTRNRVTPEPGAGAAEPAAEPGTLASAEPGPEPVAEPRAEPASGTAGSADRMEITRPGTMAIVSDKDGDHLQLRDWEFRDPSLPAGSFVPIVNDGVADAINGYTTTELHDMSHGPGCTCAVSRLQEQPPAGPGTYSWRDSTPPLDGTGPHPDEENADDDVVPNPPSDETTDETTEKEGDEVPNIEEAETPYQGMQDAFKAYAEKAAAIAKEASDDLAAQAAIHGFDRDSATMADIQALADQADALVARANSAKSGLISRHNAGEEYHGTGSDADASAFRAA